VCALGLARAGADVIVASADEPEGRAAVAAIRPQAHAAVVRFEKLDLTSLASVAAFAGRMAAAQRRIDLLMNMGNADSPSGGGRRQAEGQARQLTADGFELELGVNYLAHFALTAQLLPLLRRGRNPRVVHLTNLSQREGAIQFDDMQLERGYDFSRAFNQSKLASLMFALELQRRSDAAGWGIASLAVQAENSPFRPADGGLSLRSMARRLRGTWGSLMGLDAGSAARTALFAATASQLQKGGCYGPAGEFEFGGPALPAKLGSKARDQEAARRLWSIAERLTGVAWPAV